MLGGHLERCSPVARALDVQMLPGLHAGLEPFDTLETTAHDFRGGPAVGPHPRHKLEQAELIKVFHQLFTAEAQRKIKSAGKR